MKTTKRLIPLSQVLKFKYTWRSYQQKFLDNFISHIEDNHLHVVAPPGSGKTILGLEMLLRVDKSTLVLAPTLTIRNQWQSRLEEFFLEDKSLIDYTLDVKNPKTITFSTYQSLHALNKSFVTNDNGSLLEFIKKYDIRTIVLDEAHHLKNEWWKCLFELKKIEEVIIISLTATPPYDSSITEIKKYFDLCGPIDDEIAVPDLVKNGDLCPHQDFVHFSKPSEARIKYIVAYRENINNFINAIVDDLIFRELLLQLPIYKTTEESLEKIYENPAFFSSVLIFLKSTGLKIEEKNLSILGFEKGQVDFPNLNYEWLEILLQELLVNQREELVHHEDLLASIEKKIRRIGVFENKKVNFIGDNHLYRSLSSSASKLKSIRDILEGEYQSLGGDLKAVVLTDFIRKEFLDYNGENTKELNKLGVTSIFQYLRTTSNSNTGLAVLTGSLVILHQSMIKEFTELLNGREFNSIPLSSDTNFFIISAFGSAKNNIVATVTALFQKGLIKILIGTKSLLGEGWDAPAINTLILASYVGSFVSSNQMRGRAIRIDSNELNKTGNIWHLACIDPTIDDGGKDLEKLNRRFEAFSGVSIKGEAYIENGLSRLKTPSYFDFETDLEHINTNMLILASEREQLKDRWSSAIAKGNVLVRELKVPYQNALPYKEAKKLHSLDAGKYLLIEVISGIGLFLPEFFAKNITVLFGKGAFQFINILMAALLIGFAPKTYKALKLYFLFGNTYKKTKRIASGLFHFLYKTGHIKTSYTDVNMHAEQYLDGAFVCHLKGASNYESTLFVNLLEEIIAVVDNPRYLLVRTNWFKRRLGVRNYYVVPLMFGKRKEDAQLFHRFWKQYVDNSKLLYTRTTKGRKEVLKARLSHVIYQFKEVSKTTITWK